MKATKTSGNNLACTSFTYLYYNVDYLYFNLSSENACKSLSWCHDDVTGRGDDPEL